MPTRFERWIRSYDSASTKRTPSRRGPLAAQSREEPEPYSLPGDHAQRRALLVVLEGGVVDRLLLAVLLGEAALGVRREQVAQPDVRERPAHHHLVVAAPRAVGVEVARLDAVLDQVLARGRVLLDRAGR